MSSWDQQNLGSDIRQHGTGLQSNGTQECSLLKDRPNKTGHRRSQINNKPKEACLLRLVAMTAGYPGIQWALQTFVQVIYHHSSGCLYLCYYALFTVEMQRDTVGLNTLPPPTPPTQG